MGLCISARTVYNNSKISKIFKYGIEKGVKIVEIARVTSRGQITIPIDIRKKLGLKEGDKVIFIEKGNTIIFANAAKIAFRNMQKAFEGEAEKLGLKDEQDVVNMVDETRQEMWDKLYANSD